MQRAVALLMEAKRHRLDAVQLATELEVDSATGGIELLIGLADLAGLLVREVSGSRGLTDEEVSQRVFGWLAAGGRGPLFPPT